MDVPIQIEGLVLFALIVETVDVLLHFVCVCCSSSVLFSLLLLLFCIFSHGLAKPRDRSFSGAYGLLYQLSLLYSVLKGSDVSSVSFLGHCVQQPSFRKHALYESLRHSTLIFVYITYYQIVCHVFSVLQL